MTLIINKHHSSYSSFIDGKYIESNNLENLIKLANNYNKIIIK